VQKIYQIWLEFDFNIPILGCQKKLTHFCSPNDSNIIQYNCRFTGFKFGFSIDFCFNLYHKDAVSVFVYRSNSVSEEVDKKRLAPDFSFLYS
jgi:hypothetical protein